MVNPQEMKNGGMKIIAISLATHGLVGEVVTSPVARPTLDSTAGQPRYEGASIMISPNIVLSKRHPSELGSPDHQSIVQHPALLEVL